jgi:hypothetical protein
MLQEDAPMQRPDKTFDAWKQAFDSDPLGRGQSGVSRYQSWRSIEPTDHVMIDLEFEEEDDARSMRERLKELWSHVQGQGLIGDQQVWLFESFESGSY